MGNSNGVVLIAFLDPGEYLWWKDSSQQLLLL